MIWLAWLASIVITAVLIQRAMAALGVGPAVVKMNPKRKV